MNFSTMTWSKIGCLIVASMGLILQYLPQAQDFLTVLPVSAATKSTIGLFVAIIGAICTSVLSAIHSHQLEQMQAATPGSPSNGQKTGLFLIGFLLLATAAQASNPLSLIGIPLNPPPQGEDDVLLMPFTNINTYTQNGKTNYGLGLSWGLAYANVLPVGPGQYQISPYAYVAPYVSAEMAAFINSDTLQPITMDYGIMLGLPQLDPAIPQVSLTINWNSASNGFVDSHPEIGIATAFPLDILSGGLVRNIK